MAATTTQSVADLITHLKRTTGDVPPALIGATTTIVDDKLYLFGGRLESPTSQVLNTLYVLSLDSYEWRCVTPRNIQPEPRYFHSACRYGNQILFFGGLTAQDGKAGLHSLADFFILHIRDDGLTWEYPRIPDKNLPRPRYTHLACIANDTLVVLGGKDIESGYIHEINIFDCGRRQWRRPFPVASDYCTYRTAAANVTAMASSQADFVTYYGQKAYTQNANAAAAEQQEKSRRSVSTIFAYDLKRSLHQITVSMNGQMVDVTDHIEALSVTTAYQSPPTLQFPAAFACGHFLIVVGPCITADTHQFHIWALDVLSMVWTRLDAGPLLSRGTWIKGQLYDKKNQFLVFGHPDRSTMKQDTAQQLAHYEYLVTVDTEAFGVYSPPRFTCAPSAQEAGLALLNNPALCDLSITTIDGERVLANSCILMQRWPSLKSRIQPLTSPKRVKEPSVLHTSYTLTFPDTRDVLIAFLQFLYTDHLGTIQQQQPHILSRLLILSDLFGIARLKDLTKHSLHQVLQLSTAPMIYETATLSNCPSLQIRSLRIMVNAKKLMQRNIQQQQQQQQSSQYSQQHQHQQQPQHPLALGRNLIHQRQPSISMENNIPTPSMSTPVHASTASSQSPPPLTAKNPARNNSTEGSIRWRTGSGSKGLKTFLKAVENSTGSK